MNPRTLFVHIPEELRLEAARLASVGQVFEVVIEDLSSRQMPPEIHDAARKLFREVGGWTSFPVALEFLLDPAHTVEAATLLADKRIAPSFAAAFLLLTQNQKTRGDRIARAVEDLFANEQQLLSEEAAAALRLEEITARIATARKKAATLFGTREKLRMRASILRDEVKLYEGRRQNVAGRRDNVFPRLITNLQIPDSAQNYVPWNVMVDQASSVLAFDFMLREMDRLISEKKAESSQAEEELARYEAEHAADFAPGSEGRPH